MTRLREPGLGTSWKPVFKALMCLGPPRPLDSSDAFLPVGGTSTFNQPTVSTDLPLFPRLIVISELLHSRGWQWRVHMPTGETVFAPGCYPGHHNPPSA